MRLRELEKPVSGPMAGAAGGLALKFVFLFTIVRGLSEKEWDLPKAPLHRVKEAHRNLIQNRASLVSRLVWLLC